jgi:aspartokinase
VETVAVYCESKLKTYGFKVVSDLSLLSWVVGSDQITKFGLRFQELGEKGFRFRMIAAHESGNGRIKIDLLLDRETEEAVMDHFPVMLDQDPKSDETVRSVSPVEIIFFHGPHYGDRYGIADLVLSALERESVPVILATCSGSSIYLVLPYQEARHAVTILSELIEIPREIGTDLRDPREKGGHDLA